MLGIRLTTLREAKGLSRAELARRARVDQWTLAAIEDGSSHAHDGELVEALAVALGINVEAFSALFEDERPIAEADKYS